MRAMENELRTTTLAEDLRPEGTQSSDEDDHEFDDVEDFAPVKVDSKAVQQLVKAYKQEKSSVAGPATTLIASLGMKPT